MLIFVMSILATVIEKIILCTQTVTWKHHVKANICKVSEDSQENVRKGVIF